MNDLIFGKRRAVHLFISTESFARSMTFTSCGGERFRARSLSEETKQRRIRAWSVDSASNYLPGVVVKRLSSAIDVGLIASVFADFVSYGRCIQAVFW